MFICSLIVIIASGSGEMGRTRAQSPDTGQQSGTEAPTPAVEQSKPAESPFAKAQAEVLKQEYEARVLGSSVVHLKDGKGVAEANVRSWVAWTDGKVLNIDVEDILSYQQLDKVRWKQIVLANNVTRITVDASDPEAVLFYGNFDIRMDDLLKLFSSGFKELQAEDLPPSAN